MFLNIWLAVIEIVDGGARSEMNDQHIENNNESLFLIYFVFRHV